MTEEEKREKDKKMILGLAVGGLLLIVIVVILILLNRKPAKEESGQESILMEVSEGSIDSLNVSKSGSYAMPIGDDPMSTGEVEMPDMVDPMSANAAQLWAQEGSRLKENESKTETVAEPKAEPVVVQNAPVGRKNQTAAAQGASGGGAPKKKSVLDEKLQEKGLVNPVTGEGGSESQAAQAVPVETKDVAQEGQAASSSETRAFRQKVIDDSWGGSEISSIQSEYDEFTNTDHPVKAMFTQNEKIKSGQRVVIRLMEDLVIDGIKLTANTRLTATCSIGQGRLNVVVTGFALNGNIYNVNLVGFDNDGGEGIYCPSSQSQEDMSTVEDAAVNLGSSALASAVGTYAGTIVQTGSQLLKKKGSNSRASVEIPSGYVFFLVDGKTLR